MEITLYTLKVKNENIRFTSLLKLIKFLSEGDRIIDLQTAYFTVKVQTGVKTDQGIYKRDMARTFIGWKGLMNLFSEVYDTTSNQGIKV